MIPRRVRRWEYEGGVVVEVPDEVPEEERRPDPDLSKVPPSWIKVDPRPKPTP
ncbi:hypothetical protein [Streptodolium elevatio]|uniref:Uncharacterized protein n=1 Tax=Streptodolium elevatio TaxID=3157996 RepID=A0ABV3DLB9_9ACTN